MAKRLALGRLASDKEILGLWFDPGCRASVCSQLSSVKFRISFENRDRWEDLFQTSRVGRLAVSPLASPVPGDGITPPGGYYSSSKAVPTRFIRKMESGLK